MKTITIATAAALAGCATVVPTPPPDPSVLAAGCLGADVHACAKVVRYYISPANLPGMSVDEQLTRNDRTDVNGKQISANIVTVVVTLKYVTGYTSTEGVDLFYDPSYRVTKVSVPLALDPIVAHTAADYASTGSWHAALIAGGSRCAPVG